MDYSKLKKSDYVYLSDSKYVGSPRLASFTVKTVITFKNSSERFFVYQKSEGTKVVPSTLVLYSSPHIMFIGFLYFLFTIITSSKLFEISFLSTFIFYIVSYISAFFSGAFLRLLIGYKKIDVTNLEKISVEEIEKKYLSGIKRQLNFELIYCFLYAFFFAASSIVLSTSIITLTQELFGCITVILFNLGYLNIYGRYVEIKKIEKEYSEMFPCSDDLNHNSKINYDKLKSSEYIYLSMIEAPARHLFDAPDVSAIVTFKKSSERFYVFEYGKDGYRPITTKFYRRPFEPLLWIIYFFITFPESPIYIENIYILHYISYLPIIAAVAVIVSLLHSNRHDIKINVSNLNKISVIEIKEKYLKRIWNNIILDFLYSLFWIASLFYFPEHVPPIIHLQNNYILLICVVSFMLILKFVNIYRRVVAVRKIEKEYKESLS